MIIDGIKDLTSELISQFAKEINDSDIIQFRYFNHENLPYSAVFTGYN